MLSSCHPVTIPLNVSLCVNFALPCTTSLVYSHQIYSIHTRTQTQHTVGSTYTHTAVRERENKRESEKVIEKNDRERRQVKKIERVHTFYSFVTPIDLSNRMERKMESG